MSYHRVPSNSVRATNRSLVKPVCYFLQSVEVHWPNTRHIPSSFFFFFFAVYNVQWLSSHFKRTKRPQFLKEKFVHTETKFTGSRHKLPHFCVHFFIIFIFILTGFPSRLSLLVIYVLEVELQVWDAGHWCLGRFTVPIHYNNTLILPVNTKKFGDEIRQSQSKENRNHSAKIFQPRKRVFLRAGFEPAT